MEGFKSLPKMQHFKEGGHAKVKEMCWGGKSGKKMKEGGSTDLAQDKAMIKKAFKQHDEAEHDKEPTEIKLKAGKRVKKEGSTVRKYKSGGEVTNVYQAKKKAGDKDAIKKVKQITPAKADSASAALKDVGNTDVAFKEGGNVSESSKKAGDEDKTIKTKIKSSKASTKSAALKMMTGGTCS
jgi:hypothetical protein